MQCNKNARIKRRNGITDNDTLSPEINISSHKEKRILLIVSEEQIGNSIYYNQTFERKEKTSLNDFNKYSIPNQ